MAAVNPGAYRSSDFAPRLAGTPAGAAQSDFMAEVYVGQISEFIETDSKIVKSGALEIGVMHRNGEFFAYRNLCLHQGGPACQGMIIAKVEEVLAPDKTFIQERFSDTEIHFVCPWHGYEYDLATGEFVADRKRKLQKFEVVKKDGNVYVIV
jgi:nitrite reductase/ring-hydroxylating ferredoxin subunit